MKKLLIVIVTSLQLLFAGYAMAANRVLDTAALNSNALKGISITSYAEFKKNVKPLIKQMGTQRIIGMGEGTHGTAEFYKVRFWLSRILIEDYGFDHIAFENDYSDSWLLNDKLNTDISLDTLMRKRLLKIWQNQETKEMLAWVRDYNKTHKRKVTIDGIDYVYLNADAELIEQLLGKDVPAQWRDSLQAITKATNFQDAVWTEMNHPKQQKLSYKDMNRSSALAYATADWLSKQIAASALAAPVKETLYIALENMKEGFAPFYDQRAKLPEATRDSLMAYNAGLILKGKTGKMIVWAHNGHVAKKGIYDNEVGGTGGYLLKMFPGKYMVLGTFTSEGTFAATTESHDTYDNPMAAYLLEIPVKTSWENYFSSFNKPALLVTPATLNPGKLIKPMRFIGYGPKSGPSTNDTTNLSDLFDALIFIKSTNAATSLK